jgi:type II secretory pathway component GspD/PulD (secretin)
VTKFYKIRHVIGAQLAAVLNNWKTPQGRIIDMPLHNMLIITEQREVLDTMERILEQIDRVPAQVEIEAKVIEIRRSSNYEFGFELHVDRSPASNTAFRRFDGAFNSPSFLDSLRPGALPFQGASINWAAIGKAQEILGDFEYVLRALEKDGYAEVLSAPRIVVHSGHKAILTAKTKEPILITNIVNTTLQQVTTTFEPVGVTLEVTPVVVGSEAILLDVKPSVSSVVEYLQNPTGGLPIPHISERTADTEVDLRNGEILVIGGLFEKQIRKDSVKVPIVGHIPLIGRLFSSIDDEEIKTDVIFILKLRILSNVERADERLRSIPGGK